LFERHEAGSVTAPLAVIRQVRLRTCALRLEGRRLAEAAVLVRPAHRQLRGEDGLLLQLRDLRVVLGVHALERVDVVGQRAGCGDEEVHVVGELLG